MLAIGAAVWLFEPRAGHDNNQEAPMMDKTRRTILITGAAATAMPEHRACLRKRLGKEELRGFLRKRCG